MKKQFMFKSNWFDKGKIKSITYKGFYLYCKLHELQEMESRTETNINKLQKCTGFTHNKTVQLLNLLKKNGCITYYAPFLVYNRNKKIYDYERMFSFQFLDLPIIEKKFDKSKGCEVYIPINEENYFTVVDMEIVNKTIKQKTRKKHVLTYVLLSKFKEGKCNVGFKKMEELSGIKENELRDIICIELEMKGLVCNYGNKENDFTLLRDMNDYEKFKERHAEQRKKNQNEREKRETEKLFGRFADELFG
jgi:hypothetical protein